MTYTLGTNFARDKASLENLRSGRTSHPERLSYAPILRGDVTYGPNVPGFPDLLAQKNLTTSMTAYRSSDDTPATVAYTAQYGKSSERYQYIGSGSVYQQTLGNAYPSGDGELLAYTATKLRSAIYQAQAGSRSGVFLGELRETLRLLRSPYKGIRKLTTAYGRTLRAARRRYHDTLAAGEAAARKELLEKAASAWLTYALGVKPLAADIQGHAEHIADLLREVEYKLVKAGVGPEREVTAVSRDIATSYGAAGHFAALYDRKTVLECETRAGALVFIKPSGPKEFAESFGFRPKDFIPTIYELVPWSFLADYFSNLGDLINALFVETSSVPYNWMTAKWTLRYEYSNIRSVWTGPNLDPVWTCSFSPGTSERTRLVRTSFSGYPNVFRWESPKPVQLVTVAALGAVIFGSYY